MDLPEISLKIIRRGCGAWGRLAMLLITNDDVILYFHICCCLLVAGNGFKPLESEKKVTLPASLSLPFKKKENMFKKYFSLSDLVNFFLHTAFN